MSRCNFQRYKTFTALNQIFFHPNMKIHKAIKILHWFSAAAVQEESRNVRKLNSVLQTLKTLHSISRRISSMQRWQQSLLYLKSHLELLLIISCKQFLDILVLCKDCVLPLSSSYHVSLSRSAAYITNYGRQSGIEQFFQGPGPCPPRRG